MVHAAMLWLYHRSYEWVLDEWVTVRHPFSFLEEKEPSQKYIYILIIIIFGMYCIYVIFFKWQLIMENDDTFGQLNGCFM